MRKLLLTQSERFETSLCAKDIQIPNVQISNLVIHITVKNKIPFQLRFTFVSENNLPIRHNHHFAAIFEAGEFGLTPKEEIDFKVKRVEIVLYPIEGKPDLEFNVYEDTGSLNR